MIYTSRTVEINLFTTMKQLRFTKKGYEKLLKEYDDVLKSRPDAVMHLKKAREMGDLSENGYYKSSRAKLSFIDRQLRELKFQIKSAVIVEESVTEKINIGSTVTLRDNSNETTYHIVGDMEADPSKHRISLLSPLGRVLQGKKIGEKVIMKAPSGEIAFDIISVK